MLNRRTRASIRVTGMIVLSIMLILQSLPLRAFAAVNAERPTIIAGPTSQTVFVGASVTLSVNASVSDGGTLSYQWYNNLNEPIDGATGATFSPPTDTASSTYYSVQVKNRNDNAPGYKTSDPAYGGMAYVHVRAAAAPTITGQPASRTVAKDSSLTLSVIAGVANGTISYQWYSQNTNSNSGGTEIEGATGYTYSPPTSSVGTKYYYVVLTNTVTIGSESRTATVTSDAAKVTVPVNNNAEVPTITAGPTSQTVFVGASVTLSVYASVSDGGTLSYQWYDNRNEPIDGATGATFSPPTDTASSTYYSVQVKNRNDNAPGYKNSDPAYGGLAYVHVRAAVAPTITSQPASRTVAKDSSLTLSVVASVANGTISYQWYSQDTNSNSGGTEIEGATGYTYSPPTSSVGTKYYYVVLTNTVTIGSESRTATVASDAAKVTVPVNSNAEVPTITAGPTSQTVFVGASVTLSVYASVSDGGTLSYQWYDNRNEPIDGATGATFSPPTDTASSTYYSVQVKNRNDNAPGYKNSDPAYGGLAYVHVRAAAAPTITGQPSNRTVAKDSPLTLSVVASVANGTISYQWYSQDTNSNSGGTEIEGATGYTYSPPTSSVGTKYYYVVLTNTVTIGSESRTATVASDAAKVTVLALVNAATPSITEQPSDVTVNIGGSASLNVEASVSDSGTLSYQWYSNTANSNSGGTLISGATGTTYEASTASAGTVYYYVIVKNTNSSATGATTATVTSQTAKVTVLALVNAATPSITEQPSDVTVSIGGSASLGVEASVSDSGTLSYQWYSNTTNSNSGGTLLSGATGTTYEASTASAGTVYYYVVVTNTNNSATGATTVIVISQVAKLTVRTLAGPIGIPGNGDTAPQEVVSKEPNQSTTLYELTEQTENDQKIVTSTINFEVLEELLISDLETVTIQVSGDADRFVVQLTSQMLDELHKKGSTIRFDTDKGIYSLPARNINLTELAEQLGLDINLSDAIIKIQVGSPSPEMRRSIENAVQSGNFTLVVPAVDFQVTVQDEENAVEISRFYSYVKRLIPIPDDVDPANVTTAIVIDQNGSSRQVPTKIVKVDGKSYAQISSLTNSVYALVNKRASFSDVDKHWARTIIENMGARMIVQGTGGDRFTPDRSVTRAEFIAILVRGLGLKLEEGPSLFTDVQEDVWYKSALNTAYVYQIISGYEDGAIHGGEKLTRQEAMVMIANAMKLTGLHRATGDNSSSLLDGYADAGSVAAWAKDAVIQCLQSSIVAGRSASELAPTSLITRAEVTAIVQRLLVKSDLI